MKKQSLILAAATLLLAGSASAEVICRDDFAKNADEHPMVLKGVLNLDATKTAFARFNVFEEDDLSNFLLTFSGRLLKADTANCFWGVEVTGDKGKFMIICRNDGKIHYVSADGEGGFERDLTLAKSGADAPFETLTLRRRGRRFQLSLGKKVLGSTMMDIGTLELIQFLSYNCFAQINAFSLDDMKAAGKPAATEPAAAPAE